MRFIASEDVDAACGREPSPPWRVASKRAQCVRGLHETARGIIAAFAHMKISKKFRFQCARRVDFRQLSR
jgi:hypothetical protein